MHLFITLSWKREEFALPKNGQVFRKIEAAL
jgi:hypothetical protein